MLSSAISFATFLLSLRGIVLPFWQCSSAAEVFDRAMTLSDTEANGVVFGGVLAFMSAHYIIRHMWKAIRRWRRRRSKGYG